jgi:hypothetical protein
LPQHGVARVRFLVLHAALALACCTALPARAQLGITPGRVLDTIQDRKPTLPLTPPEVIFEAPRPEIKHDPGAPRFSVNAFTFSGSTVFPERLLKRLVERGDLKNEMTITLVPMGGAKSHNERFVFDAKANPQIGAILLTVEKDE